MGSKTKRPSRRIGNLAQPAFSFAAENAHKPPAAKPRMSAIFRAGDRSKLFIGNDRLDAYLRRNGKGWVLRFAERMEQIDVSSITKKYEGGGRPALHPRIVLGLIVFGYMQGLTTLRQLEDLARCDVRAWWVTGGEQPDHSTIGKFVENHSVEINGEIFASLVQNIVRSLELRTNEVAIDATTIQAAGSHWNTLKKEAAEQRAKEAAAVASANPSDARAQARAAAAEKVASNIAERAKDRRARGKKADAMRAAVSDPDAVNQPLKNGAVRPSYKPSVLATPDRIVVAQHVEASSEQAAVIPLLELHERHCAEPIDRLLGDGAYGALEIVRLAVERSIDLLSPTTKHQRPTSESKPAYFGKHLFVMRDDGQLRCPTGLPMHLDHTTRDRDGKLYKRFSGTDCSNCPLRAKCTSSGRRTLKWYDGDDAKAALAEVMRHPLAKQKYRQRSAMVEPVFAQLRCRQGLQRFRRRGLNGVRVEFALHAMAYNVRRAEGIQAARRDARIAFVVIGGPWIAVGVIELGLTDHAPRPIRVMARVVVIDASGVAPERWST